MKYHVSLVFNIIYFYLVTKSGNGIVYVSPKNLFNKYINPIFISSKDFRSMFLAAGPTIQPRSVFGQLSQI